MVEGPFEPSRESSAQIANVFSDWHWSTSGDNSNWVLTRGGDKTWGFAVSFEPPQQLLVPPIDYRTSTAGRGVSTQALLDAGVQAPPGGQPIGTDTPTPTSNTEPQVISYETPGVSTKALLAAGKQEPENFTADRSDFFISQAKDAPDPENWFACGATSFLNALADWGLMKPTEANRQKLIDEEIPGTGQSTREAGQFPGLARQFCKWARNHGLNAEDHTYDTNIDHLDKAIAEGKGVILNAPNHYLYIIGKDDKGRYVVADPGQPNTEYYTRREINEKLTGGRHQGFLAVWRGELNGPREVTA